MTIAPEATILGEPATYYVAVMTVARIEIQATSTIQAAQFAIEAAKEVIDPKQATWKARYVSQKPFEISDDAPDLIQAVS